MIHGDSSPKVTPPVEGSPLGVESRGDKPKHFNLQLGMVGVNSWAYLIQENTTEILWGEVVTQTHMALPRKSYTYTKSTSKS